MNYVLKIKGMSNWNFQGRTTAFDAFDKWHGRGMNCELFVERKDGSLFSVVSSDDIRR